MASLFFVKLNEEDVKRVQETFACCETIKNKVMMRVTNDVLAGVKTDTSSEIREVLNISKTKLDVNFSAKKATLEDDTGIFYVKDKAISFYNYSPTQTQKGVTVKIYKDQPRKLLESTFIATVKAGLSGLHTDVFWRDYVGTKVGKYVVKPWSRMPKKYRLPIEKFYGPRLTTLFCSDEIFAKVKESISARQQTALDKEINYELSKVK